MLSSVRRWPNALSSSLFHSRIYNKQIQPSQFYMANSEETMNATFFPIVHLQVLNNSGIDVRAVGRVRCSTELGI